MKGAERRLKRYAYGLARRASRNAPLPLAAARDAWRQEPPRRVLVIRQDRRLGNLVLTTPLLAGLRRLLPDARLEIVAPVGFAAVFDAHPAVDRVLALDHRAFLRAPWRAARMRRELRSPEPAGLVIDASPVHHFSFLSGLLCAVSGAPYRLGFERRDADAFLNLLAPPPPPGLHEHRNLHALARAIAPDIGEAEPPFVVRREEEAARAARAFERWGWSGRPVVGLHPGGRRRKRWPVERFEETAKRIEAGGAGVLVFAGRSERPLLEAMSPPGPTRIYAPPTDLRGLIALVGACRVFLSGDCGPMHLAAALGVRCVSVFRVADAFRYGPSGPGHRVLDETQDVVSPADVAAAVLTVVAEVESATGYGSSR